MSGDYDEFKVVTDPANKIYEERFDLLDDKLTLADDVYTCDEDCDLTADYSFDNPDFVYSSFQSNLVFRWEYRPGSTLYLVWSLNNELDTGDHLLDLPQNIRSLNDEIPFNVFLVKLSYRLGR